MSGAPNLTDRKALKLHRARAAVKPAMFLHEEAAAEIEERLAEVNKSFNYPALVGHVTSPISSLFKRVLAVSDEEELELQASNHDLVIHSFGLHWSDDPVGQLVQSRLALQPDGLFLGIMFGGTTLHELRACLAEAETRMAGGLSPRVLPMADLRDLGSLLQRAGFALPVADSRKLRVRYPDLQTLVHDLRGMGETNALSERLKRPASKAFFTETETIYRRNFSDNEGYLTATFEIVFLTGWAPSDTQPQALQPGSAKTRLADVLGVPEIPLTKDE